MKNEVYNALIEGHTNQRREMSRKKGDEYAHEDDRLDNFKRNARALGISPELVLMVYAEKHFGSIQSYVKKGCPYEDPEMTEPIVGRIYDLQNYMDLLLALLEERHQLKEKNLKQRKPSMFVEPEDDHGHMLDDPRSGTPLGIR